MSADAVSAQAGSLFCAQPSACWKVPVMATRDGAGNGGGSDGVACGVAVAAELDWNTSCAVVKPPDGTVTCWAGDGAG